jgi:nitrogen fixation NifU-like protein
MAASPGDFWQAHSLHFLEMAFRSDKRERLSQSDGYGKNTGECGDTIEMFLVIREGIIDHAAYETDGCLHTNACANTVVAMIEGKPLHAAWEVTPEAVAAYLETLPEDHFHCAELAVGALYKALANARQMADNPWKKAYSQAG